jgi:hypothetical protein
VVDLLAPASPQSGRTDRALWKKSWFWVLGTPRAAATPEAFPASFAELRDDVEWRKIKGRVLHDRPWCERPDCFLPATEIQAVSPLSNNVVSVCRLHHSPVTAKKR